MILTLRITMALEPLTWAKSITVSYYPNAEITGLNGSASLLTCSPVKAEGSFLFCKVMMIFGYRAPKPHLLSIPMKKKEK